jgi:hypothetical protein
MPHELRQQWQRKIAIRKQNRDQTNKITKLFTQSTFANHIF